MIKVIDKQFVVLLEDIIPLEFASIQAYLNRIVGDIMNIEDDFEEIENYAHFWRWLPDWSVVEKIYKTYPDSYSVQTPFAYTYLEELIRTLTFEYGLPLQNKNGKEINKKAGIKLINLAIQENEDIELIKILEEYKKYFRKIKITDIGDNRNSVNHGIIHPDAWSKESFKNLIHDIASISKYARF